MNLDSLVEKAKDKAARHKERHSPSGFGFALADSIRFVDPVRWDALTKSASVFLQRPYLAMLEAHGPSNLEGRYALVFRGDTPVAAVAAQMVEISGKRVGVPTKEKNVLVRAAKKAASAPLAGLEERVLVCGNLLSWGQHAVAFAEGEDPAAVWPAVAEALYRLRRADRLHGQSDFAMVKDLPGAEARSAAALERFSYRAMETEPNMVLALPPEWRSFDDYLAGLKPKYRKTAKEIADKVEKAGIRLETVEDVAPLAGKLHGLYLQVHEHASFRPFTLPEGLIPALAQTFGKDFRCRVARRGDEIVGFITSLKDGETAMGYYVGFDRATNAEAPLYFRLLYAAVEDALALGCRRLSLGRTALEPKARLGARPEPMKVYLRHRVPMLNVVVRALLSNTPHEDAPERNPFK